ncbi:FAD-dependent monooxygenase [Saccharothrix longispora]|uniref:FAD-dependent monooxygenase n=1 Tax=Saccharothrix longispora TaxID=33920 RepID=UPI0028FD0D6C|nr:FAD-dependent monooxygenase [Saccharothrix longispora]MBY8850665.1 FAD-dependent monooxygenase [Saccharothrix sp. MB29]MDU0287750.1 FAD-dependent monooxygenase [Saccharothrix longispora]
MVVVVGAGPTGLATACALRLQGVAVRVVDGAPGPATTSRALGLQPRGSEVLERLGALGDLPERSVGIRRVVVHVGGRRSGELRVGRPTRLVRRPGLLVSQAEVEAGLRARLADLGVRVEWGTAVTGLDQDERGAVLSTTAGRVAADWVIGCDGAHSAVRKAAGIGFPGVPLVEGFVLGDVRADLPLPRDAVGVWVRGGEMFSAFPLPGGVWRFMAPAPGTPVGAVPEFLSGAARRHAGLDVPVGDDWTWASVFRIQRRLAETYRRGRVLLAGDAAHIHSPFGGQGMNTGLGDAENLAWRLALVATGRAGDRLLDGYQAERRPVAEEVLSATSGLTGLVLGESRPSRLVRDRVLFPLMTLAPAEKAIWERASQLRTSYARSPFGRRPRVGDRVARFAATGGFGWTLAAPRPDTCAAAVRDALGEVRRAHHDGDALLVRPDGHLAWRGEPEPDALRRAVAALLHR